MEKLAQFGNLWLANFTIYSSDEKTKADEMDKACSRHGKEQKCMRVFGEET